MKRQEKNYLFCLCCCHVKKSKYIKISLTVIILTSFLRIILQGIALSIFESKNLGFYAMLVDLAVLLAIVLASIVYLWYLL